MRHKHRRDANERAIVRALRAGGASVHFMNSPGLPDLLVGYAGRNCLLEVKGARGRLTAAQTRFMQEFAGTAHVVGTVEEALKVLQEEA